MKPTILKLPAAAFAIGVLAVGCSTLPERIDSLERARATVAEVEALPQVSTIADEELERARNALERANEYYEDSADIELIRHEAYIAMRYAETARALVEAEQAQELIAAAEGERDRIRLEIRERETAVARLQRDAAKLGRAAAEQQAASAAREAELLAQELADLRAEETERGLVLTLGEVLFEVDKSALKPGAMPTIDRLAQFLRDHEERRILIEGHTDSHGSDQYNLQLSEARANAVREALLRAGIDPSRIVAVGRGEGFPVATNETVAGRQENRRVEIVISDDQGKIAGL